MSRYFIHMAYDGTVYHGWQVQPNGLTVQEVMEKALSTLLQEEIAVTGAGRTDTGVHASCFIAHFDRKNNKVSKEFSAPDDPRFLFKLNRFLPKDIVIHSIAEVNSSMHARFSATHRTYHYNIATKKPLFRRNYEHYIFGELDVEAIEKCCRIILETTDFTSFSKLHTDVKTNDCNVSTAKWNKVEGGYVFEITADRFLRNMVRSIVGTLLDVGQGKMDAKGFKSVVNAMDRGKAGQSAPGRGLFLVDIGYDGFRLSTPFQSI